MAKLRNIKTKVVKDIEKEFEASMYLATGEWEIAQAEKQDEKPAKTPIINKSSKDEK